MGVLPFSKIRSVAVVVAVAAAVAVAVAVAVAGKKQEAKKIKADEKKIQFELKNTS